MSDQIKLLSLKWPFNSSTTTIVQAVLSTVFRTVLHAEQTSEYSIFRILTSYSSDLSMIFMKLLVAPWSYLSIQIVLISA